MRIQRKEASRRRVAPGAAACLALGVALTGCDSLLEVTDPDLVVPDAIARSELFWAGAIGDFMDAASSSDGMGVYVGLFTDEFELSGTFPTRLEVDERSIQDTNGTMEGAYRDLHAARVSAENAAGLLTDEFGTDSRIGEMNNLAGYTYIYFGEVYCSGVPYGSSVVGGEPTQGMPTTTDETFQLAIARFDAALSTADGNVTQQHLANIGKARAQLALGQFAAAATTVAAVPDDFVYLVRHDEEASGGDNGIYSQNVLQGRWTVADGEGTNGVQFRTAMDDRLQWMLDPDTVGFDSETFLYRQLIFTSENDDISLASGLEARLIEAEAALDASDFPGWLGILNQLRTDAGMTTMLADPGTTDGRVRLHFEERAWWLYATGHRLGDLRRMIRHYGYTEDQVFPTGTHFKGSAYGDQVVFPIPEPETNNPNFTGCLNMAA